MLPVRDHFENLRSTYQWNMLDRAWLAPALSESPWSTNMHSGSVSHGTLENDSTTWLQTEVQLLPHCLCSESNLV